MPRGALRGTDDELLLVDWLNALVYEMATRTLSRPLRGEADGIIGWRPRVGRAARSRAPWSAVEIKGATYTALRSVDRADGVWIASAWSILTVDEVMATMDISPVESQGECEWHLRRPA